MKQLLAALIVDSVRGHMKPQVASAAINGVGKMLKIVEMEQKYGIVGEDEVRKELTLYKDTKRAV